MTLPMVLVFDMDNTLTEEKQGELIEVSYGDLGNSIQYTDLKDINQYPLKRFLCSRNMSECSTELIGKQYIHDLYELSKKYILAIATYGSRLTTLMILEKIFGIPLTKDEINRLIKYCKDNQFKPSSITAEGYNQPLEIYIVDPLIVSTELHLEEPWPFFYGADEERGFNKNTMLDLIASKLGASSKGELMLIDDSWENYVDAKNAGYPALLVDIDETDVLTTFDTLEKELSKYQL